MKTRHLPSYSVQSTTTPLLMTALRNCGRTAASLGDTDNSYARRKSRIKQEKMNGLQDKQSFEEIINEI